MSTQIFIKPDGCKVEYTKINADSFSFNRLTVNEYATEMVFGASTGESPVAIWSGTFHDYLLPLPPSLTLYEQPMGIPLPINLVADDRVTISGNAVALGAGDIAALGYEVYLTVGVYYFNCTTDSKLDRIPAYTFIPVENFLLDGLGMTCFETSVTLGSNFDTHDTRFLVGFNISTICTDPGGCENPPFTPTTSVSYTFDIERPCTATIDNFIIRNCCEPIIEELVHIPGLTVGNFHVDDEGNCWEVMSASKDVTNFTRNFVDIYGSCVECQAANACPNNLVIASCCVPGKELVSGSLPGLNLGDTFVDNNGLCWFVESETSAPISEESITVDTEIIGTCDLCKTTYPCPKFWVVYSCCGQWFETIATNATLNAGDSFVDTNGICWSVAGESNTLPTNYNIVVDTVYPGPGVCDVCTTANPCPTEYFLTIRMCCDSDRIEVTSVPSELMSFSEGSIFSDLYKVCWEVMSYSTSGVETYTINWNTRTGRYATCRDCAKASSCVQFYEVKDCQTDIVYTAVSKLGILNVGSFYVGLIQVVYQKSCFEVLGYGYPQSGVEVSIDASITFGSCVECAGI